jgi:hypothetical protein
LSRPPVRWSGSMSGRCGSVAVMSSKVWTVWNRRPGEVGFYCLKGIGLILEMLNVEC